MKAQLGSLPDLPGNRAEAVRVLGHALEDGIGGGDKARRKEEYKNWTHG